MADKKDYWIQNVENGNVRISEEVIASIASVAATEVEGVDSLRGSISTNVISTISKKAQNAKGVKIQFHDDEAAVEIAAVIKYGYVVTDVAKKVQQAVKNALESMTNLKVSTVDVSVCGIAFEKAGTAAEAEADDGKDAE